MLLIALINTRTHIPDTCFRFVETAVFSFFHADETVALSTVMLHTCHMPTYNNTICVDCCLRRPADNDNILLYDETTGEKTASLIFTSTYIHILYYYTHHQVIAFRDAISN